MVAGEEKLPGGAIKKLGYAHISALRKVIVQKRTAIKRNASYVVDLLNRVI